MNKITNQICILAPAKINLNLDVLKKDFDGYHFLNSQICFINLCDYIYLSENSKTTITQINKKSNFILKSETIIFKTLMLFKNHFNWEKNFKILFSKNIPIGAGLGGGSADAAATLLGLMYLYNKESFSKKITNKEIIKLGFFIGSDVPSCIYSNSLFLSGKGEIISPSQTPKNLIYLIIYPDKNLSTKKVFSFFKQNRPVHANKFQNIEIRNSLLLSACEIEPVIKNVLNTLKSLNNIKAFGMTGSGSTCFGIFSNSIDLKNALEDLKGKANENWFIWHGSKKEFGFKRILY